MSTAANSAPPIIGIRDSGVGGLTVAHCIRELLPRAILLYFADTAHVPYGDRTPEEVRHFAFSISRFLIDHGAHLLVFACNTSSAYALDDARHKFPIPIIGMIEPGAQAALNASGGGTIGVLATQATVDSNVYPRSLERLWSGTRCVQVACPAFVPLVESEQTHSRAAYEACRRYLRPLIQAGADTIILGCTHYPLLLPMLRELAPQVQFIDPAEAVAAQVALLAEQLDELGGPVVTTDVPHNDIFFASGPSDGVRHWISKLLPQSLNPPLNQPDIRRGPVFDLPL
ncbi:MAG: glutamate racemase [Armatimonadota bacterium]|nr:glutamate racemase [Armatimonadota bacterium]